MRLVWETALLGSAVVVSYDDRLVFKDFLFALLMNVEVSKY
jgi:hypothetical protein